MQNAADSTVQAPREKFNAAARRAMRVSYRTGALNAVAALNNWLAVHQGLDARAVLSTYEVLLRRREKAPKDVANYVDSVVLELDALLASTQP